MSVYKVLTDSQFIIDRGGEEGYLVTGYWLLVTGYLVTEEDGRQRE